MRKLLCFLFFIFFQLASISQGECQQQVHSDDLQIVNSKTYNVSGEQLWKLLSERGHLTKIHSYLRKDSVVSWPGKSSDELLLYYSGLIFERRFTNWIEGVGYDLQIINRNDPKAPIASRISWRIEKLGNSKSKLTITVHPAYSSGLTLEKKKEIFAKQDKPFIDKYFISLLDGINYYLTTGKKVTKNQFGGPLPPF